MNLILKNCKEKQPRSANPFLAPWERISDGEPRVFSDPNTGEMWLYIYGSHDTSNRRFCGEDHVVWSAPVDDLTNWRHDGVAFHIRQLDGLTFTSENGTEITFDPKQEHLYAPDVIYHPQRKTYYMFVFTSYSHHMFVAESDRPEGPYIHPRCVGQGFDPAVLVDDEKDENGNQRIYLYWSVERERSAWSCELDPVTLEKIPETLHVPIGHDSAENGNGTMPHRNLPPFYFFEGPSIRKVGGFYVLSYAKTDDLPGNGSLAEIGYAYSDNPYGDPALGSPWQYGGVIVDNRGEVIRDPYSGGTIFTYKGGNDQATALLEKINENGEFYVGINIQAAVTNGTAAITILKYGTSEADATTPVGTDSKEPEPNEMEIAPIADPSTVEANKPAIRWSPETVNIRGGNNCTFTVLGDNTWRVTASDSNVFFNFNPKRSWSFAGEDFPVFGILVRNIWVDGGTVWYAAGEIAGALIDCTMPFSIYDGDSWEGTDDIEYFFVPIDMTDLWEGRINTMRLDLVMSDAENREFNICFAGMFRTVEEGTAYAEEYLKTNNIISEDYTKAPETETPDTDAADTNDGETNPADTNGADTNASTDAPHHRRPRREGLRLGDRPERCRRPGRRFCLRGSEEEGLISAFRFFQDRPPRFPLTGRAD